MLQMVKIKHRIYKWTTYPPKPPHQKSYLFIAKTKYFFECVSLITSVFRCFGVFRYFYKKFHLYCLLVSNLYGVPIGSKVGNFSRTKNISPIKAVLHSLGISWVSSHRHICFPFRKEYVCRCMIKKQMLKTVFVAVFYKHIYIKTIDYKQ